MREVLEGAELNTYLYWGVPLEWKLPGLPIEGFTSRLDSGTDLIDLCHTELRNSLMSHQFWRNYVSFMEAELALFQDLGLIIDRREVRRAWAARSAVWAVSRACARYYYYYSLSP